MSNAAADTPAATPAPAPATESPGESENNSSEERPSRRRRGRRGKNNNGKTKTTPADTFKGNTLDMNGHVFQTHGETTNRQQFADTVEALAQYINKTLKYPGDVVSLCKSGKVTDLEDPNDLTEEEKKSATKEMLWRAEVTEHAKRKAIRTSNLHAVYAVAWGQCSPTMQAKLKSLPEFESKDDTCDTTWLLQSIKGITHAFEGTRYLMLSLTDALASFYNSRQNKDETLHEYLKNFRAAVEILDHYGASIGEDKAMLKMAETILTDKRPPADEEDKLREYNRKLLATARGRCLAVVFLKGADRSRFGTLWADLENQFTRGNDQYPCGLTSAYNLLTNYQSGMAPKTSGASESSNTQSGMSFLQHGEPQAGNDGNVHAHIMCYRCNRKGHYASQCPEGDNGEDGVTLLQAIGNDEDSDDDDYSNYMFTFTQTGERLSTIPSSWILLDSQSTVSVFRNKRLLSNVRQSAQKLKVHTNGGSQVSSQIGDVRNFGTVWYNPSSLANILSMAEVRKVCRITMDTDVEPAMCVHRKDGTVMKFLEYASGLYFHDVKSNPVTNVTVEAYTPDFSFINTIEQNKEFFTAREIAGAERARKLYKQIGPPSQKRFEHILANNLVRNCPVTVDDAKRALMIFGPDVSELKGKMTKKGSSHVPSTGLVPVPAPILHLHPEIILGVDILYINGNPFLHTIARKLKYRTITAIESRKKQVLLREITSAIRLYTTRGFKVGCVHADQEFGCIRNDLLPIPMNIADTDDHVPEVERSIRTIKERVRAQVHALPYKRLPKTITKAIAEHAVRNLNQFPPVDGVSTTMSPMTIVTGQPLPDYRSLQLDFGEYVQVFEERPTTNTTRGRSTGAIALYPNGNLQGGYYFMSLTTGERLSRRQWVKLPTPEGVISRVEELGALDKQPTMIKGEPIFEWTPGETVEDDGETDEHEERDVDDNPIVNLTDLDTPPIDDDDRMPMPIPDEASVNDYVHGEPENQEGNLVTDGSVEQHPTQSDRDDESTENDRSDAESIEEHTDEPRSDDDSRSEDDDDDDSRSEDDASDAESIGETVVETVLEGDDDGNDKDSQVNEATTVEDERECQSDRPEQPYNLRANRERNYSHRLDAQMDAPESSKSYRNIQFLQIGDRNKPSLAAQRFVTGFLLTQMTANAGIKKHGERAVEALYQEFAQLNDKTVFEALNASTLTRKQKREALRLVNLIKEKRTGKLKGRTCADGRPQRALYTKEETTSPTVTTEALLMSLLIDAQERRDVACADVAGAYLLADMDTFTIVVMTGETVDIMCKVNPDFEKYVVVENGKKVLYLRLVKALYGCVKSALLWYELFSSTLQKMGFELNPYDPCVANKQINGTQCTIAWYVDDNKISHKDPNVVTKVIEEIETHFGKMVVTRGNKHNFLGMDVELIGDGTVKIQAKQYLEEAIEAFGEVIDKDAPTPAGHGLFGIDPKSKPLDEERKDRFHRIVAKLLYICKRARLDIQLPIAFLCTRVSKSTEQDWEKLRRVLQYVRATIDEAPILGADDISMVQVWADAAFAVHADMKSHTGGGVSFGRGTIMSKSEKQKLNTKSSTEAELVGASDVLPSAIWLMRFLEGQGYEIKKSVLHQDNQSAIKLAKNGRKSAGKRSRHIDIRYFFIKDRVKTEGMTIEYCPTERMLADFFTKPLQGGLFRKLKAVIMGHDHTDALLDESEQQPSTGQERVGNSECKYPEEDKQTDGVLTANEAKDGKRRSYADVANNRILLKQSNR